MGGSGGYRRLPGGSDHFSLQTHKQTLHHNIYIDNNNSNKSNEHIVLGHEMERHYHQRHKHQYPEKCKGSTK